MGVARNDGGERGPVFGDEPSHFCGVDGIDAAALTG
jgi:hypothetical protein